MGDMVAAINYMVIAAVLPALLLRLFSRGFASSSARTSTPDEATGEEGDESP
jgi:hypothetical protein